jgi:hypothetical protein
VIELSISLSFLTVINPDSQNYLLMTTYKEGESIIVPSC